MKLVTSSYLKVGISLTAGSSSKFTSVATFPPFPSSLNTAYPRTGHPPSS